MANSTTGTKDMGHAAHGAVEKAKDTAHQAVDKAKDVGHQAMDKAKDMASHAGDAMSRAASSASSAAGKTAENLTASAASGARHLADTVREKGPQDGMLGGATRTVADKLEQGGRYLEEEGFSGMMDDVTELIRRNPVPAVLVGIGVGFLIGRTLGS